MHEYIAVHHNGQVPIFTYTDSLETAKRYLSNLITAGQVSPTDSMAIVRAQDDQIIYFKLDNNTAADFAPSTSWATESLTSLYLFITKGVNWITHPHIATRKAISR